MKLLPKLNFTNFQFRLASADCDIVTRRRLRHAPAHSLKQRGVVLFLTLIALLAMSLAAVALIRSVDTSALIAGNLAFKQAAAVSGGSEIEAALTWLKNREAANAGMTAFKNDAHTLNLSSPADGYYSYLETNAAGTERSLTDASAGLHFDWKDNDSSPEVTDADGNKKRHIIQRLCRINNTRVEINECLFGGIETDPGSSQAVPRSDDVCNGPGCPVFAGETPQYRITVQIIGPRNTISYVQAYAY